MNESGADFYQTGGSLSHDAPSYVERDADRELFEALLRGEFCYVLTARQMGKSSLMIHTTQRLREEGVHVIVVDLTAIGENLTAEQWYLSLLGIVGRRLGLEDELDDFWDENDRVEPLVRFMRAIREVVLPFTDVRRSGVQAFRHSGVQEGTASEPERLNARAPECPPRVVIFIDEIDTARSLPFSTDEFFAAIRECYNRRTEDPEYHRLTFCLLGVATPSDLIRDVRRTPFNIGRRIELNDFTEAEAAGLALGLSHPGDKDKGPGPKAKGPPSQAQRLLQRILHWTGGHPYLTQRLCQAVAEQVSAPTPNTQHPRSSIGCVRSCSSPREHGSETTT